VVAVTGNFLSFLTKNGKSKRKKSKKLKNSFSPARLEPAEFLLFLWDVFFWLALGIGQLASCWNWLAAAALLLLLAASNP